MFSCRAIMGLNDKLYGHRDADAGAVPPASPGTLPLWATMAVCFLSMAAAVSDRVTMTSRASCRCMLVRLVSPHSWGQKEEEEEESSANLKLELQQRSKTPCHGGQGLQYITRHAYHWQYTSFIVELIICEILFRKGLVKIVCILSHTACCLAEDR